MTSKVQLLATNKGLYIVIPPSEEQKFPQFEFYDFYTMKFAGSLSNIVSNPIDYISGEVILMTFYG